MAVVYRYIDLYDEKIKYVGIVWSQNRTLDQRITEHYANDEWCKNGYWKIEYLQKSIKTRTDAEYLEAHYINKFGTNEYYNISKSGWGESSLIDDKDDEWIEYKTMGDIQPSDMEKKYDKIQIYYNFKDESWYITSVDNYSLCMRDVFDYCVDSDNKIFLKNAYSLIKILLKKYNAKISYDADNNFYKTEKISCNLTINHSEINGNIKSVCFDDILMTCNASGYLIDYNSIKNYTDINDFVIKDEIDKSTDVLPNDSKVLTELLEGKLLKAKKEN